MTDFDIRDAVLAALEDQTNVSWPPIGVGVHGGVVTLSGQVGSLAEKDAAGRVALRAEGVRGLALDLNVAAQPEVA